MSETLQNPAPACLHAFGIRFWNGRCEDLLVEMDERGGVLTVPSAPSLGQAGDDPFLMEAYRAGDWSVVDGGYCALTLRGMGVKVRRISGLQIIEKSVAATTDAVVPMRQRRILWVMPNDEERARTRHLLHGLGFDPGRQHYYLAPYYRSDEDFADAELIRQVKEFRPDWIILGLAGGRQEKLAYHLRRIEWDEASRARRDRGPAILCTGAAIAFFSGGQVAIPKWADRMYLGWAFRAFKDPKTCVPRYIKAFWHFPLLVAKEKLRGGVVANPSLGSVPGSTAEP
ncbi:WecB/TagA/CpsF family glycosyltransferase [Haloferula sargassicola]|uniref:Glycosyltransferase n=1 Tax=Haloferula sargassicola TaxID=490096 RepID=A0ABP9UTK9_9BACT